MFLAATGLRIGEALAVRWRDLADGTLTVERRLYDGQVDAVKSDRSARRLPLAAELVTRLEALRAGEADAWVFQAGNGSPLNPKNVLRRQVKPAARALGIELGGFHDFRHTLATRLRRSGTHPKVVSSVLGHARVHLALNVYDHVSTEDLAAPLAEAARQLCPNVPKTEARDF